MGNLRVYSLYSGSTGNAFVIDYNGACILIDAGKSAKKLCAALTEINVDPSRIAAILVTHEHSDHIKALPVFLKKHPIPVHLPVACASKLEQEEHVARLLHPHPPIYTEDICGIKVSSFPTPHDSRGSVGYRFEIPCEGGCFCMGYATDIGHVSKEVYEGLCGCDAVILESNHDLEMLQNGPYPYDLKLRIASRRGHLSNPDSAALAAKLCKAGTKRLMLAHLSQENNTPDTAYDECLSAVGDERVQIAVADPECVTEFFTEEAL